MGGTAKSMIRNALTIPIGRMRSSDRKQLWRTAVLALVTTLAAIAVGVSAACFLVGT